MGQHQVRVKVQGNPTPQLPQKKNSATALSFFKSSSFNCFVEYSGIPASPSNSSGLIDQPNGDSITRPVTNHLQSQSNPFPPSAAARRLQVMGRVRSITRMPVLF